MEFLKKIKMISLILLTIVLSTMVTYSIASIWHISAFAGSDGIFMPSVKIMENVLKNNTESLSYASNYMINLQNSDVRWDGDQFNVLSIYHVDNNISDTTKIIDPILKKALRKLYNEKLNPIIKENNYILFVRWTSLNSSCGILYCPKGKPQITESGNTKITKSAQQYWYLYKNISD